MSKVEVSKFLHDLRNALHELDTLQCPRLLLLTGLRSAEVLNWHWLVICGSPDLVFGAKILDAKQALEIGESQ
ncbi:hypothetical protein KEM48_002896 [Puccinia striiformis f. sp. tritici PST-130]|nr:hypothetical protein KEM48_002896 [Puccinia striiformis f. sp. tritici PST-130]